MENNVFTINNNKNKSNNSISYKRPVLKMIELFSFWITVHFVIYALFHKSLPSWTNPTFWLLYGFIIQLVLFIFGRKIMPNWFKINVFVWKLGMLIYGLMYFEYNMSYSAINFNLLLMLLYLLILEVRYNKSVLDVYFGVILTKNYHSVRPKNFIMNRLRNII